MHSRSTAATARGKLATLADRGRMGPTSKFLTGIEADSLIEGELFLKLEQGRRKAKKIISLAPVKFKGL